MCIIFNFKRNRARERNKGFFKHLRNAAAGEGESERKRKK
jgi:hypothetical protein